MHVTENELIHMIANGTGFIDVSETAPFLDEFDSQRHAPRVKTRVSGAVNTSVLDSIDSMRIQQVIQTLSSLPTRYFQSDTAVRAVNMMAEAFSVDAVKYNDSITRKIKHSWKQPSLIVRLPGVDPELKAERVIVGCHLDSINIQNPSSGAAPGADDDASGCAASLEAFHALTRDGVRRARTIEFHSYAAEEVGLRGSMAIAAQYAQNDINVRAMLELDMVCYGTKEVAVVIDNTDDELNNIMQEILRDYTTLSPTTTTCGCTFVFG